MKAIIKNVFFSFVLIFSSIYSIGQELNNSVKEMQMTAEQLVDEGVRCIVHKKNDSALFYINLAIEQDSTYSQAYFQKSRAMDKKQDPREIMQVLDSFFLYHTEKDVYESISRCEHLRLQRKLKMLTMDMFQDTLQNYYLSSCDSMATYSIQVYNLPTYKLENISSVIKGFYGALFMQNTVLKEEFENRINEFTRPGVKDLFLEVLNNELEQVIFQHPKDKNLNDFYYGAYFATGNVQYLSFVLKHCEHSTNKEDEILYLLGGTALWSLSSNSEQHESVLNYLKTEAKNKNKYAKKILKKNPLFFHDKCMKDLSKF